MATDLLVSGVAIALGVFIAVRPLHAAKTWGSRRLAGLSPDRMLWWLASWRALGILLGLAGVLLGVESVVFRAR